MNIKSIRLRKLISGPGYNHHALEIEAEVQDGDDPMAVLDQLAQRIDVELHGRQEEDRTRNRLADLIRLVEWEKQKVDRLQHHGERIAELLTKFGDLAELADAQGLPGADELMIETGREVPF